jgi:peptide methionine sulfoxide reductase msrA/msrB
MRTAASIITIFIIFSNCNSQKQIIMTYNKLTPEEERVIIHKGTEAPFSGKYNDFYQKGTYHCRQCNAPLYRSSDKFNSHCGWPSFDDEIPGAVKRQLDADGRRTEILCANCGAHLGHVFEGENLTEKNVRHCVNSVSLQFVPESDDTIKSTYEQAIFAGGCFWGVEYYMQKARGVISTEVGYIGGKIPNPTYKQVCSHTTGHAEAVKITFDPSVTSYEEIAKLFFEIHDPTQIDGQGPDIGDQYRSEIFYLSEKQKEIAQNLIDILKTKGYKVVTRLTPATTFYKAEDYHQNYYSNNGSKPYCHFYRKKF